MKELFGVEYGRGCTANVITGGPASAPTIVRKMFPNATWTTVTPDNISVTETMADRFGENFLIQKKIYAATPTAPHVMIGGDHSVNFGHFTRIADMFPDEDICLIYIDAHLDMHTPESSRIQASGAPHGTNVRALLGDGDARWMTLARRHPTLKPENVFYIGIRSFEDAEIKFVHANDIFMRTADNITTRADIDKTIAEIRSRIGAKKYVVSFDFDAIDPRYFGDVLVPETGGLTVEMAAHLVQSFAPDATSFEFVEYSPTGDVASHAIAQQLISIAVNA